jgi:hypothetical protein
VTTLLIGGVLGADNFLELRHGEVRRIYLPRTRVNKDKKQALLVHGERLVAFSQRELGWLGATLENVGRR